MNPIKVLITNQQLINQLSQYAVEQGLENLSFDEIAVHYINSKDQIIQELQAEIQKQPFKDNSI